MSQFIITETIPYPKEILKILEENKELKEENKLMKEELDEAELEEFDKQDLLEKIENDRKLILNQMRIIKNLQEQKKVADEIIKFTKQFWNDAQQFLKIKI